MRKFLRLTSALVLIAATAAVAQSPAKSPPTTAGGTTSAKSATANPSTANPSSGKSWAAPGTKGSPIDGTAFHAQVLLDAAGFSPGVIDGKKGMSLDNAVKGFQQSRDMPATGKLDNATKVALLQQNRPSTIMVKLTPDQVAGPFVYPFPKKPEAQAKLKFMGYRNMLEKLAEEFHTTPATIVALNGRDALIGAGQTLRLPNVVPNSASYDARGKDDAAKWMALLNVSAGDIKGDHIMVSKREGLLKVLDSDERLVAQFPVTTGSAHDPLPLGDWKVPVFSFLPPFNYQPDLFWDVADDKAEQKLAPGPNGPVGLAWLDLTKEHYGIHGTGEPQTIARTQSHGCLRLTNWDVLRLSQIMKPGFKAKFVA
ncbi:MAG: L,D-transpeptidase family protein [Pseudomonadota bacterium]